MSESSLSNDLREYLVKLPFIRKLWLYMMFGVMMISLLFLGFFVYHTRDTGMRELEKLGIILTKDLAWESELGVLADDIRFLHPHIDIHYKQEDVVYSRVYDKEGKLLAGKSKLPIDISLPDNFFIGLKMGVVRNEVRKIKGFRIYDFILPITTMEVKKSPETLLLEQEKEPYQPSVSPEISTQEEGKEHIIGYARVGLSMDQVESNINEIIKLSLMVTSLFVLFGIVTTYLLAKNLTRPITSLTEGVKAIIGGDLKQHIQVQSKDEFAELAEAFNEMTQRLRKRMEEIRQKNEELENFAHTVSHDLKAPLISIQGFSSMLQKKKESGLDEKGRFYLERIQKNVERMDQLIHDLLRLSRIGRVKAVVEPVETKDVIEGIMGEIANLIKEKKVQMIIPDDLPVVYSNKTNVYQIFSNLINNAVKFIGDESDPKIELNCKKTGDYYEFGVKDNGVGIDKQFHQRIFGMFQRLDDSTEGTGVGLAIVKRLVELEGGVVRLESEVGKGTTFYVTIPGRKYQEI